MPYFVSLSRALLALILLSAIIMQSGDTSSDFYPQVATSTGIIRGNALGMSRDGREFYQFLGIPYAIPPVGSLRFQAPLPLKGWDGIRMAARQRKPCLQFDFVTGFLAGSEDCLYLNVYVPKIGVMSEQLRDDYASRWRNTTLLPVMVFIYGGGWMYGSADTYGADYFMDEDVILVTFNHRLGALGFLNTGDGIVRGNMGLKDQNMVLRWIQENILQFGGDPLRVTLFGQSAGASAVHYHMLSPMSKGLFHKAISQSGSALRTFQFIDRPAEQARRLGSQVNCQRETMEALVECLRKIDANKIARAHMEILDAGSDPLSLYAATAEVIIDENTFLATNPFDIVLSGNYYHVPWMTGITSEDGLVRIAEIIKNRNLTTLINNNWNDVAPRLLNYDAGLVDVAEQVKRFYLPANAYSDKNSVARDIHEFINIFSDRYFFTATRFSALQHAKYAPTFTYYYTYSGKFTFFSVFVSSGTFPKILDLGYNLAITWAKENILGRRKRMGICHGDELAMLFPIRILSNVRKTDPDYHQSRAIVKAWVEFATHPTQSLQFQNQPWPAISPYEESNLYMNLNVYKTGLIREPFTTRAKFWESLNLVG